MSMSIPIAVSLPTDDLVLRALDELPSVRFSIFPLSERFANHSIRSIVATPAAKVKPISSGS